jgi:lipopolysaccharide/colanic/teichoic acid biosynthesis glycosyltransferase
MGRAQLTYAPGITVAATWRDFEQKQDLADVPWTTDLIVEETVKPGVGYDPARPARDLLRVFTERQAQYSQRVRRRDVELQGLVVGAGRALRPTAPNESAFRGGLVAKRIFDLVLTSIVFFAVGPLMALIALAIKVGSPGPVFFRAIRFGRGNLPFYVMRFRTFDTAVWVRDGGDQRRAHLTTIGAFLRKTGLAEVPGLLNVLRGEMSLVGPRPLQLAKHDLWQLEERQEAGLDNVGDDLWQEWRIARAAMKPGMTGPWVLARDGDLRRMMELEVEYAGKWSLRRDLRILVATLHIAGRPSQVATVRSPR